MMLTRHELARFAAAMAAQLGLRVDERAGDVIERRAELHRESIARYLDRVEAADRAERDALASELTVGETYFLRHIEQFRAFAGVVVPDRARHGRLHVLSAGCSSGEEPYTLAILLHETPPGCRFAIRGLDVNPRAIARARAGRYSRWSLRAATPGFEQRWFQVDADGISIAPEIRSAVTFEQANVLDAADLAIAGRWDVVFCRNLMMYFTDEQADALIARIRRALAPGGYLFLGHAETLRGRTEDFALRHSHGTFYYQRDPLSTAPHTAPPASAASLWPALDAAWCDDIREATQRVHAMIDDALDRSPAAPSDAHAPGHTEAEPAAPDLDEVHELIEQERFAEALAHLDRLRAAGARDRDVATLRALVLTHSGPLTEARTACTELLALDATSAGANYLLALCCDSTGDVCGATQLARIAADLDPSFAMPRVHLGLLARRVGDREIASRELTHAIALLEREAPSRLALYGGGFSRQTLLGMCRAELAAIGAPR